MNFIHVLISISESFNINSSKLFNYSKLVNDKDESPVKRKTSHHKATAIVAATTIPRTSNAQTSRQTVDDQPLIDLSDTSETVEVKSVKKSAPNSLNFFDSLLNSNPSHYGNLELQKPLLDNNKNDPFDISSAYRSAYSTGCIPSKPQNDSPQKQRQPIVYSRTHSQDDRVKSSSEKEEASIPPIPPRGVKSLPPSFLNNSAHLNEKGAYYSLPNEEKDQCSFYKNVPEQGQNPVVNIVKPCLANDLPILEKPQLNLPPIDQRKTDLAFGWLNDALNNFSLSKDSKFSAGTPLYDQVPDETGYESDSFKVKLPPPLYDEVPMEEQIQAQSSRPTYAVQSDADDISWDSFDSDFDDDDEKTGMAASAPLPIPCDPDAPPLPPRDYLSSSLDSGRGTFKKKEEKCRINPIKQDGKQLSHTHYFLLAPREDGQPKKPNTAEIKPFAVDGNQLLSNRDSAGSEYANVPNLQVNLPGSRLSSASDDLSWTGMTGMKKVENSSKVSRSPRKTSQPERVPRSKKHLNIENLSTSPREKVFSVMNSVLGVTDEECHAALCHASWDTDSAIRFLKTEQLFRLGITNREKCAKLLDALNWNLELASSVLLDEVKSPFTMESQV